MTSFPPASLEFLAGLREHNERAWFDAHRREYERDLVEPAKEFVRAAAPVLERLAPGVRAEPRVLGSIFRINRDTRFSPDKRPYKDHLDFWFWHGERAQAASGLFLRLSPDEVWMGAGAHDLQRERLERFRAAVCDPAAGAELARLGRDLDDAGIGIAGSALRRPPSGFSPAPDAAPSCCTRRCSPPSPSRPRWRRHPTSSTASSSTGRGSPRCTSGWSRTCRLIRGGRAPAGSRRTRAS